MMENSWNVSFRRMYDLPYQTHRNLVEPVSGQLHLKKLLIKRFLSFIEQIQKSSRVLPKQLLRLIQSDTRSITGSNLRRILLLVKKTKVENITKEDIENLEYATLGNDDIWRVDLIKEITNVKFGQTVDEGLSIEELKNFFNLAVLPDGRKHIP